LNDSFSFTPFLQKNNEENLDFSYNADKAEKPLATLWPSTRQNDKQDYAGLLKKYEAL